MCNLYVYKKKCIYDTATICNTITLATYPVALFSKVIFHGPKEQRDVPNGVPLSDGEDYLLIADVLLLAPHLLALPLLLSREEIGLSNTVLCAGLVSLELSLDSLAFRETGLKIWEFGEDFRVQKSDFGVVKCLDMDSTRHLTVQISLKTREERWLIMDRSPGEPNLL